MYSEYSRVPAGSFEIKNCAQNFSYRTLVMDFLASDGIVPLRKMLAKKILLV